MSDIATEETARHALPFIMPGQAMKHIPHNEALMLLDALLHPAVESRNETIPPAEPAAGSLWIVAAGATGAWSGRDGMIAHWCGTAWRFYPPLPGMRCYVLDEGVLLLHVADAWTDLVSFFGLLRSADLAADLPHLGVNATADDTNRLSVRSPSILFSHEDTAATPNDCRIKINKTSYASDAQISFERDYSARAIAGLSGNDSFSLKVSKDGALWHDAFSVDHNNGDISFGRVVATGDLDLSGEDWLSSNITVASDTGTGRIRSYRARGTLTVPQPVEAGDVLFSFTSQGHDGTGYEFSGGLTFIAETDYATAVSSSLRLTTVNAGVWTEAVRILADGRTGIGTSTPQTKLDVRGPVRIGSATVSALPAPGGIEGSLVFVTDAAGGAVPAYSDGTQWRRVDTSEIIS